MFSQEQLNKKLEDWLHKFYFPAKNNLSYLMDLGNQVRSAPAVLGQAKDGKPTLQLCESVNAHLGKLEYHLDPLGGALDHYTHPSIIQHMADTGKYPRPCDCDDFALKGRTSFLAAGVNPDLVWLWNLVINAGDQLKQMDKNHVLCGFSYFDSKGEWTGVLDTNSAYNKKILWHRGHAEDPEVKEKIMKHFSSIYSCNYKILTKAPDPWYENGYT